MTLDCTFRIRTPHRSGKLAEVTLAMAQNGARIGDVTTLAMARDEIMREITLELRDWEHAEQVSEVLGGLEGVKVLRFDDRALIAHDGGKVRTVGLRPVRSLQDVRDVYTPGVGRVCLAVQEDPEKARTLTSIGRSVAICTNGTRVHGLGDIGPVAAMPVMEGKALFYSQLVGVTATPILIDTKDADEFVETVLRIAPGFGAIHLEDISVPACFEVESRLKEALDKPVMHDDVDGTAVVTLAAVIAAVRKTNLQMEEIVVGQIGLGASGFGIATLIKDAGVRRVFATDLNPDAVKYAQGAGIETGSLEEIMAESDVVIATSGRSDIIDPALVRKGQIILALTNPNPEIDPEVAMAAGAAFAADGTSVNNVLGFPGIFRGALEVRATKINLEMLRAAARTLAAVTERSELVPDVLDPKVHMAVADAVIEAAINTGVAGPEGEPIKFGALGSGGGVL